MFCFYLYALCLTRYSIFFQFHDHFAQKKRRGFKVFLNFK